MTITRKLLISSVILSPLMSQPVLATDWTDNVVIKGFASAVYQQTDESVFFNGDCRREFTGVLADQCPSDEPGTVNGVSPELGGINEDGAFRRTRVGLNINANVNNRTTLQTQFLVLEEEDEYKMHLDWGFIKLELDDNNSIRVGKIKMPVGLVNEYQSVGHAFPWIEAPQLFYSADFNGSNITRESYRGISYFWQGYADDWVFTSDIFWGGVALEGMSLTNMLGYTLKVEWDESIYMQASTYSGTMAYEPRMSGMLDKKHRVSTVGFGGDLDGFLFYAEYAHVTMGMIMQESDTWYASTGYQFDDITFMLTHQDMQKGQEAPLIMRNAQTMDTITLRYDFALNTAIKFELSQINTDQGFGLFAATNIAADQQPADSVNMFGLALELTF